MDIVVNNTLGTDMGLANWTTPTAGDALVISTMNPGNFPIGSTEVIYFAIDSSNNRAECAFLVNVTDIEAPVLSCPSNITLSTDFGMPNGTANWTSPVVTDNSGIFDTVSNFSPGTTFPIGTTEVVYTATDAAGNEDSCHFNVNVVDIEAPVLSCPSNVTLPTDSGMSYSTANWTLPDVSDNSGVVDAVSTFSPGTQFSLGTTDVVYTATDMAGNQASCYFNVNVVDLEEPVITPCPGDIYVDITTNISAIAVNWMHPNADDNVFVRSTILNYFPNRDYPIGSVDVVYFAQDSSGNNGTCSFTVIVRDLFEPTFTICPGNISLVTDPGTDTSNFTVVVAATDNHGEPDVSISGTDFGGVYPLGASLLTFVAVDNSSNMATCTTYITVIDTELPSFDACPSNVTVGTDYNLLIANVSWPDPSPFDNVGVVNTTYTDTSGSFFPLGTTLVSYFTIDAAGNGAFCDFAVTIYDDQTPVLSCPNDILTYTDLNANSSVVDWASVTVSDNEPNLIPHSYSEANGTFLVGTTNVTYFVVDSAGNSDSCTFYVTVEDDQAPTFVNCSGDLELNAPDGVAYNVTWSEPTAFDNVGVANISVNVSPPIPELAAGAYQVVYTAVDVSGLIANCSFFILVIDDTAPNITCPSQIMTSTLPDLPYANVSFSDGTVSGTYTFLMSSIESPSNFSIGSTPVTFTVSDDSGNMDSCSFSILVQDTFSPVIANCPEDITITATLNMTTTNVTWTPPTISDNSGSFFAVSSYDPGSIFEFGTTTVTYIALDAANNRGVCSFAVKLIDNESPMFQNCPSNFTRFVEPNLRTGNYSWTPPTVSDNFGTPTVMFSHVPPLDFGIGITMVTYTAVDAFMNVGECSFFVSIVDNEAPIWSNCPTYVIIEASMMSVNWTIPSATDNDMVIFVASNLVPGDPFFIGNTTVVYSAQDPSGNLGFCIFNVEIIDAIPPTFVDCPTMMNSTPAVQNYTRVTFTEPVARDNSGSFTVSSTHSPGDEFPVGSTEVVYTVVDGIGFTTTCIFYINVTDVQPPAFTGCPSSFVVNLDPANFTATATWAEPVSSDNVGIVFQNQSHSPNAVFGQGTTTVVYSAYDAAGLLDVCAFDVSVRDIQPPSVTGCRTLIIQSALPTVNYTVIFWTEPSATDRFPPINVTRSHAPLDRFYIGYTNVTYTFTDANGNDAFCMFQVWIQDNTDPVIDSCPGDSTVGPSAGNITAMVTWEAPTATDNSGTVATTASELPPAVFWPGDTVVTYDFSDPSGNTVTCLFTYTIADTIPPEFTTCPNSAVVPNTPGFDTGVALWVEPAATDNALPPDITSPHSSGDSFNIGLTEVIYTATDAFGLQAICNFTIMVDDNENPVVHYCPGDITVDAGVGQVLQNTTWLAANATDNSGSVTVSASHVPGSEFMLGTTVVTYTFTDPSGNAAQCSFDVTVIDITSPEFSGCLGDLSTTTDAGQPFATVNWTAPVATDESGTPVVDTTNAPNSQFVIGTTEVVYTATDATGNTALCTFNVTVSDNEPPVIGNCPANTTSTVAPGENTAIAAWTEPTASDNDPGFAFNSNVSPGEVLTIGIVDVTYLAVDPSGNSDVCIFALTLADLQPPTISNCSDMTVGMDVGESFATVIWSPPIAIDNDAATLTSDYAPGDSFQEGTTVVTYLATDPSGNTASCNFSITVEDQESPVIMDCPVDLTIGQEPGEIFGIANWTIPTVTDNVNVTTFYQSFIPPGQVSLGSRSVTYLASDAANNINVCTFFVMVLDVTPPGITNCPSSTVIQSAFLGVNYASVFFRQPVAASDGDTVTVISTHKPFDNFTIGTTSVVYTFTDTVGNEANCTFMVLIQDNELPVITGCPTNISFAPDPVNLNTTVTWTEPAVSDNSGMETITQTHSSPTWLMPGITEVLYRAVDPSGNSAECRFYIGITDEVPPVITSCPASIIVSTDIDLSYSTNVTWTVPNATDNTLLQSLTSNYSPGQNFSIGLTRVVYTAVDAFGLTDICEFNVTVEDLQSPVISDCPSNITLDLPSNSATAIVTLPSATTFDNSGQEYDISNYPSGSLFPYGRATVIYTVMDPSGNQDSCSFFVTIDDVTPPTFLSCPNDISIPTNGSSTGTASWDLVTAIDNNGLPTMSTTHTPGEFPIGVTVVEYTATDVAGNDAICCFNVTVIDNFIPSISGCPQSQTVTLPLGQAEVSVSWTPPMASDNSGTVSLEGTASPNENFTTGNNSVMYTATDDSGNVALCSFAIDVIDDENPTILCPVDIVAPANFGVNFNPVMVPLPTTDDNVGVENVTRDTIGNFVIGNTTIVYTVVDYSGNEANCSFIITVFDDQQPIVEFCPGSFTVLLPSDASETNVTWEMPEFSDNDNVSFVTDSFFPGNYSYGSYQVVSTATDPSQNTAECVFTVNVDDESPPVVSGCSGTIQQLTAAGNNSAWVNWTEPTATDNSIEVNVSSTHYPPELFAIGPTSVTYVFVDVAGNTAECSFDIIISDEEVPEVIGCPGNDTIQPDQGSLDGTANWTEPIFIDNSGNVSVVTNYGTPTTFEMGTFTVAYVGTDPSGNSISCTFTVTVQDTIDPVFENCPSNQSVVLDVGDSTVAINWTEPTATDNSVPPMVSNNYYSGDVFDIGIYRVTYTAVDPSSNFETCSFNITVQDLEIPTFVDCPSVEMYVVVPIGDDTALVNWTAPVAMDNSGNVTLTSNYVSPSTFSLGSTTVIFTATDGSGNVATCEYQFVVTDDEPPQFQQCPTDIILETDPGLPTATFNVTVVNVTDNAGTPVVSTDQPGNEILVGETVVVLSATDTSGNNATCTFTIEVVDLEPPFVVSCADVYSNVTNAVDYAPPSATDNVGVTETEITLPPGSVFQEGTTEVFATFKDASGNNATCVFNVTVVAGQRPLVLDCPDLVNVTTDVGNTSAAVTWSEPTYGNTSSMITIVWSHEPGNVFSLGVTTVIYSFTDGNGLETVCEFDVIVTELPDVEPPVFDNCPSNITRLAPVGQNYTMIFLTDLTASDNSNRTVTIDTSKDHYYFFQVGSEVAVYTAMDTSGNSANCSFEVFIIQDEVPQFDFCPNATIEASMVPGGDYATVTWPNITATDESGPVMVTDPPLYASGSNFSRGTTSISYTAMDATGNFQFCSFYVVVTDDENPTFEYCPANVTAYVPEDEMFIAVNWTEPTATDNDKLLSLMSNYTSPSTFPVGATDVMYVATDRSMNTADCSISISVLVDPAPVFFNCPIESTIGTSPGLAYGNFTWDVNATDDSPGPVIIAESISPGIFPIGDTPVVIYATDSIGNVANCSFVVRVDDVEAPELSGCPGNLTDNAPFGYAVAVGWTLPNATDNSGFVNLTSDISPGSNFEIGVTAVTYVATDGAGFSDGCTFFVNIREDMPPEFQNCSGDITVNNDPTLGSAIVTFTVVATDDLDDNLNISSAYSSGDAFSLGSTTVTYVATDYNGQSTACTFSVTVNDNEDPVFIDCPEYFVSTILTNETSGSVFWIPPSVTDNSGAFTVNSGNDPGDVLNLGDTAITYLAIDPSSNLGVCSFTVTVEEDQLPTFTDCPGNQTLPTEQGEIFGIVTWTIPTAEDAESSPTVESNFSPGDELPLGETTVEYVATDSFGQTVTCSFVVTVVDLEPPSFVGCPTNQSLVIPFSSSPTIVSWNPPTAIDNDEVGGVNITSNANPGDAFNISMHEVIYVATDSSGNQEVCSFIIFVEEDAPPIISGCPGDISLDNLPGEGFAPANWTEPNATDANSIPTFQSNYDSGNLFVIGDTTVAYVATDNLGSRATCTFTVTVMDVEDPVIAGCPAQVDIFVQSGDMDAAIYWAEPTVSDNSDNVNLVGSHGLGERLGVGSITVTYTATDGSSNIDTCTFTVSVEVATGTPSAGNILLQRVRGLDAPFTNITGFNETIREDLDDLFRASEIGPNFFGLVVDSTVINNDSLTAVAFTLFSDSGAGLQGSEFERVFDASLTGVLGNEYDVGNEVPAFQYFYVGIDLCNNCTNGGNCTRLDRFQFQCSCPMEWTGDHCQRDVDECQTGACPAEKDCTNYNGSFTCNCPIGQFDVGGNCIDAKQFTGAFNIDMLDGVLAEFTAVLLDPTSADFIAIAERVQAVLDAIFNADPTFIGSVVRSLSSGSIRVSYILNFLITSPMTADQVTELFNSSLSNMGEIENTAIFIQPLEGMLEEICPEAYCQNGGTCSADPDTLQSVCSCQDRFIGDRCENESFVLPLYIILSASLAIFLFIMVFFLCCVCCLMQSRPRPYPSAPPPPSIFAPPPIITDKTKNLLYPALPVHQPSCQRKPRTRRCRRELNNRRHIDIEREAELYYNNYGCDNIAATCNNPAHVNLVPASCQVQPQPSSGFSAPYIATGQEEAWLQERIRNSYY